MTKRRMEITGASRQGDPTLATVLEVEHNDDGTFTLSFLDSRDEVVHGPMRLTAEEVDQFTALMTGRSESA